MVNHERSSLKLRSQDEFQLRQEVLSLLKHIQDLYPRFQFNANLAHNLF